MDPFALPGYGEIPNTLNGLTSTKKLGRPRSVVLTDLTNLGGDAERVVFTPTVDNLMAGLRGRFELIAGPDGTWQQPPKPQEGSWAEVTKAFKLRARRKRRMMLSPMEYDQFIASLPSGKRDAYGRALIELERNGLLPKHTVVRLFIKKEKQAMKLQGGKWFYPLPRLIRPMAMEYNLALGVYIKPLEKIIYSLIGDVMGGPSVSKGMDSFQIASVAHDKLTRLKSRFGRVAMLSCDIKKFELCVSVDAHKAFIDFCCWMLTTKNHKDKLRKLLEKQLNVRFVSYCVDGVVKFKCEGTLCSGVMNTSLWAVLLMSIALIAVGDRLGLRPGIDYDFLSAGDDTNPFVPVVYLKKFTAMLPEVFLELGFIIKVDAVTEEFSRMDFCQCRPVWDGARWRMVREPNAARSKDSLFIHEVASEKQWNVARGSIANCGLALCRGMPVMQSYYLFLGQGLDLSKAERREDSGMGRLAHGLSAGIDGVTEEARFSYYVAFGVEPYKQWCLEQLYSTLELVWQRPQEFKHSPSSNLIKSILN